MNLLDTYHHHHGGQVRLMRLAEKSLEALDLDQARFAEDLKLHQQDFATTVDNLAVVC